MNSQQIARVTGVLFLITYIVIAALPLYSSVLDDPRYILGAGADAQVRLGAFLEFIVVIANIGTAVVLYPIVKRQNQVVALGYVATRIVESMIIAVGIFSLLSIVTLRQDLAGSGADTASLVTAGRSLVALHDWTFLFGPGILAGLGNGILLGYLLYRSDLVPRRLAMLGSSEDLWFPLRGSPCCSGPTSSSPCGRASRQSWSLCTSCLLVSISPSRDSSRLLSPLQWTRVLRHLRPRRNPSSTRRALLPLLS
jgi:hypothetical protein